MNPHRAKLSLRVTAVALTASVPIVLAGGLLLRLDSVAQATRASPTTRPPAAAAGTAAPSVEAFGPALSRVLRPALEEAPPGRHRSPRPNPRRPPPRPSG